MNDLFQLSAPWWHFVLRSVAIYVMVMVLIRVSGKRAVGQFTPFDLVLLDVMLASLEKRYASRLSEFERLTDGISKRAAQAATIATSIQRSAAAAKIRTRKGRA